MQHKTLEQLQQVASLHRDDAPQAMSRRQRLKRWAEVLGQEPGRLLSTLPGTEDQPAELRKEMRSPGSALSVAFEDPILRAQGLESDSYGEAQRFFDLTDWQMHEILCFCHHGSRAEAHEIVRRVRNAIWSPGASGVLAWLGNR